MVFDSGSGRFSQYYKTERINKIFEKHLLRNKSSINFFLFFMLLKLDSEIKTN